MNYKNIQGGFVVDDFKFTNKLNYKVRKGIELFFLEDNKIYPLLL